MLLKQTYKEQSEIPQGFEALYTLKNDVYMLTGIDGLKTIDDVNKLQSSLNKERTDHKATKELLRTYTAFGDVDTLQKTFDELEELRILSSNDGDLEKIVAQKTDALVRVHAKQIANKESEISNLTKQLDDLKATVKQSEINRTLSDLALKSGISQAAIEDVVNLHGSKFEFDSNGDLVVNSDDPNYAGLDANSWFEQMKEVKSYWWPMSQGGGATGSNGSTVVNNPFAAKTLNITEQMNLIKNDPAKAKNLAKLEGIELNI